LVDLNPSFNIVCPLIQGPSWLWSYSSSICNYLCN